MNNPDFGAGLFREGDRIGWREAALARHPGRVRVMPAWMVGLPVVEVLGLAAFGLLALNF